MRLVVPSPVWQDLRSALRDDGVESAGIAFANPVRSPSVASAALLISEVRHAGESDYLRRGSIEAELTPAFVASSVRAARDRHMSVVFFHTHPFSRHIGFSPTDDAGEAILKTFVEGRIPGSPHASLVLSPHGQSARALGEGSPAEIVVVGSVVRHLIDPAADGEGVVDVDFDRQVRALGPDAQRRLARLRVAIVGLGGTGSIAAQELAHLGVKDLVLIDPDVVEPSNLNRVVGASPTDVGKSKVDVAARAVRQIRPSARVRALRDSVLRNSVIAELRDVDAVFCCTDSHGSRYVLNEVAYRFLVPTFDCGVAIVVAESRITHVSARVQMLGPGLPCLNCTQTLAPEMVRRDLMTDFERSADPYVQGSDAVPEPAIISINGTAVSLAVTMFLSAFAEFPSLARHLRYDGLRGVVRNVEAASVQNCVTCSAAGALAAGDSWPLPGRQ